MIDTPQKLDKWMKKHKVTRAKFPSVVDNIITERTVYRILKRGACLQTWLAINHFLGKYK